MSGLHIDYHAVVEALEEHADRCALCAVLDAGERAFWDSMLFSQVGTEGFQDRFLSTDGFCPTHVGAFAARHDGTAVTMLYAPLLRHRRAWLRREGGLTAGLRLLASGNRGGSGRRPGPESGRASRQRPVEHGRRARREDCLLCERVAHWTRRFAINLLRHQGDARLRAAVEAGGGLCVQHLRTVVREGSRIGVPRAADWLVDHHFRVWDDVVAAAEQDALGSGGRAWRALLATMEGRAARE